MTFLISFVKFSLRSPSPPQKKATWKVLFSYTFFSLETNDGKTHKNTCFNCQHSEKRIRHSVTFIFFTLTSLRTQNEKQERSCSEFHNCFDPTENFSSVMNDFILTSALVSLPSVWWRTPNRVLDSRRHTECKQFLLINLKIVGPEENGWFHMYSVYQTVCKSFDFVDQSKICCIESLRPTFFYKFE